MLGEVSLVEYPLSVLILILVFVPCSLLHLLCRFGGFLGILNAGWLLPEDFAKQSKVFLVWGLL